MGMIDSAWKFITGHDRRLRTARETIQKSAGSLEDLAFRENGAAKTEMLKSLHNINDILTNAKADIKPILEEEFPDGWRQEVKQKAWIQYIMNTRLFEIDGKKKSFFEMVDYTSPYMRNEELAKQIGIYRASFNFKYEELMEQFIEKIQEYLLKEVSVQIGGPDWDPVQLGELDSALKLAKTIDRKSVRKIVNQKFTDFLLNQLEIANHRADVRAFQYSADLGKFYFPLGASKFHILADRIDYMLRDLKNSEDPAEQKRYQDHIQKMRVMEVRVFEERAKRNAKIAQSRKQSLKQRAAALRNMTFYLDEWARPLNRRYAEMANSEEHGQYQELELFDPSPEFYEDIINELFLDLDPIEIRELPTPEDLKETLDNVIVALSKSVEGLLSAEERQLETLKKRIASEEKPRKRRELQEELDRLKEDFDPDLRKQYGYLHERYYPYHDRFVKAARKLVAEVMDKTKERLYAAARNCDNHSVSIIQDHHDILRDTYGKEFPEELNVDFNDELDNLYRENIAEVLEDLAEALKKALSDLELGLAKKYEQIYDDKQKVFAMYIPKEYTPADIAEIKAQAIEKARETKTPEEIKAKADGLYQKAEKDFTASLADEKYLDQAIPTLDQYVELCKLFPETGVSEDQLKERVEALVGKFYDKAEASKDNVLEFMPYAKTYLVLAQYFKEILGPTDFPSIMKRLGFEIVSASEQDKPRELEIEIEEEEPDSESH
ncbi:hypothetical protein KY335_05100 [Candidatus Woesearchaeota archaeon]|nr:hypothetical protein [Candidatus Woesearchaeota archaeon]